MLKQFLLPVIVGMLFSVVQTAGAAEQEGPPVVHVPGIGVGTTAGNGMHGMSPGVPAPSLSPPRTSGIVRTAPRFAGGSSLHSSPGTRPYQPGIRTEGSRSSKPFRPQMSPAELSRSKVGHPGMRPGGPGMHPAGNDLFRSPQMHLPGMKHPQRYRPRPSRPQMHQLGSSHLGMHQPRSGRAQIRQPGMSGSRNGGRYWHR